jgi:hypothetical protein
MNNARKPSSATALAAKENKAPATTTATSFSRMVGGAALGLFKERGCVSAEWAMG